MEKYPECHILHIQNQYKKKYKEKYEIAQRGTDHLCYDCLQEIYNHDPNSSLTVYRRLINRIINNINNYV
jgi:hypothetical protein